MSIYSPLEYRLAQADQNALTLSFEEIEKLLGRKLPPSAYDDRIKRQWWANTDTHVQAKAWLKAGRKAKLDAGRNEVTFIRETAAQHSPDRMMQGLTPAATRLIQNTARARGIDITTATTILLNDLARDRRRQILSNMDRIRDASVRSTTSSVDLLREDRDAR